VENLRELAFGRIVSIFEHEHDDIVRKFCAVECFADARLHPDLFVSVDTASVRIQIFKVDNVSKRLYTAEGC